MTSGGCVPRSRGELSKSGRTDRALWWVSGVEDASGALHLWAVGEGGRVVRWRADACESVTTGVTFAEGEPTYWGVLARAPDDVWIVGGSARPDGPRGVLLHGDGVTWRQEHLPESATGANLYKLASDGDDLYVVGSGGLILRRLPGDGTWVRMDAGAPRGPDDRLFTVSCADGTCFAVGGSASGVVLTGNVSGWRAWSPAVDASLDDLPGLNGVWARGADDAFVVGADGLLLHLGGGDVQRPARRQTTAILHAVGGFGAVVIAVGGELSNPTPTQRGVILVQGDGAAVIRLDGQIYASGGLQGGQAGAGQ